jgi:hypothetical protein
MTSVFLYMYITIVFCIYVLYYRHTVVCYIAPIIRTVFWFLFTWRHVNTNPPLDTPAKPIVVDRSYYQRDLQHYCATDTILLHSTSACHRYVIAQSLSPKDRVSTWAITYGIWCKKQAIISIRLYHTIIIMLSCCTVLHIPP